MSLISYTAYPSAGRELLETMLITSETDFMLELFYSSIVQADPTDELEERLQQMTLPEPALPNNSNVHHDSAEILYHYPYVIDYLQNSVRSLQYEPYPLFD